MALKMLFVGFIMTESAFHTVHP